MNKLKNDFKIFRNHCIDIQKNYNTYNLLFFSGHNDLLKKAAHAFFYDLSIIMRSYWLIQVSKLFDQAQTKKKEGTLENISINLINLELKNNKLLSQEILCFSKNLLKYGKKITPARNKLLAHSDRTHQINGGKLGSTTEKELISFLDNLQSYCDAVGLQVGLGPLDFACSPCPGDALDLLKVLENYFKESCDS